MATAAIIQSSGFRIVMPHITIMCIVQRVLCDIIGGEVIMAEAA